MTISWRTATGLSASTSASLTWTLPTGHTVGDLLVAIYGGKPYSGTSGTPTGYAAQGSVASGSVGNSNGSGSTRAQVFTKTHTASESNPTATVSETPSPSMVAMLAATKTEPGSWFIANTTAADSTLTGTTISATGAGSLTVRTGERVVVVSVGNDNLESETSAALAIGSATFTITQMLSTTVTSTGNDGSMFVYDCLVTAGGTGTPVFTATSGRSGNSTRAVVFLQLWEPVNRSQTDDIGTTDTLVISFTKALSDAEDVADQAFRSLFATPSTEDVGVTDTLNVIVGIYQSETGLGVTDTRTITRTIPLSEDIDLSDVDQPTHALTGGAIPIEDDEDVTDSVAIVQRESVGTEAIGVTDTLNVIAGLYQSETGVGITDSRSVGRTNPVLIEDPIGVEDEWLNNPDVNTGSAFDHSALIDGDTETLRDLLNVEQDISQSHGAIGIADDDIVVYKSGPEAFSRTIEDKAGTYDSGGFFEVSDTLATEPVGVSDTPTPRANVVITDSIEATDSSVRGREICLSDNTTTATDIATVVVPSGTTYDISVPVESIGVTDDQPDVYHYVPSTFSRSIEDRVGVTHQPPDEDWTGYAARGREDSAGTTESVAVARCVALSESIGITDPTALVKNVNLTDAEGLTDSASTLRRGRTDRIGITDGTPDVRHDRRGYIQVPVPDDVEMTDSISIRRVVTVSDMLDVIDVASLRSPTLKLGVNDVVDLAEPTGYPDVFGWRPVWTMTTPTVKEAPIGGHRLFHFYKNDHGVSLLIHGTTVTEKRWPTVDELEACDRYYLGGHETRVDDVEADFLINAGYGDYLTLTQEKIVTYS